MIDIAVLLTCYNRKEKTISCLQTLFTVIETYNRNKNSENKLFIVVYLTDDGCTDGTSEAVLSQFPLQSIKIVKGNGSLYWAGGMRKAWTFALKDNKTWKYFLLLNDDTDLCLNLFDELFAASHFCLQKYGKEGLVSGLVSSKTNPECITYGGDQIVNKLTAKTVRVKPKEVPVLCDMVNANILLVNRAVVDKIGIFYKGFIHGKADYDYSIQARKVGFPVVVTSHVCGKCDNDHGSLLENEQKILKMTFRERMKYYRNPVRSSGDYLCLIRRTAPLRFPIAFVGVYLKRLCPIIYYKLSHLR